jgi:hypothetical protein
VKWQRHIIPFNFSFDFCVSAVCYRLTDFPDI